MAILFRVMWMCSQCRELIEDQFDSCWKCGSPKPAAEANATPESASGPPGLPAELSASISGTKAARAHFSNPGAAVTMEATSAPEELTEQEIRAFVGSNAEFYLRKWDAVLRGRDNSAGFNWAAFWLAGLWVPYRKLYLHAVALYAIMLLLVVVDLSGASGHSRDGLAMLLGVICGAFGNGWYLSHARATITGIRSQRLEGEAYLQMLARRGGTSLLAPLGFMVALFGLAFAYLLNKGAIKV